MKRKPLGELIRDRVAIEVAPRPGWFGLLPEDARLELDALKRDWKAGNFQSPKRTLARSIVRQCADAGLKTPGIQGVETWLSRD
jgi:hypothetical protein